MIHKKLRRKLRAALGDRRYRITRDDELHVYGTMPNTNKVGWYLIGWIHDESTERWMEELFSPNKREPDNLNTFNN